MCVVEFFYPPKIIMILFSTRRKCYNQKSNLKSNERSAPFVFNCGGEPCDSFLSFFGPLNSLLLSFSSGPIPPLSLCPIFFSFIFFPCSRFRFCAQILNNLNLDSTLLLFKHQFSNILVRALTTPYIHIYRQLEKYNMCILFLKKNIKMSRIRILSNVTRVVFLLMLKLAIGKDCYDQGMCMAMVMLGGKVYR